jgi:hypothetical protein
MHFSVPSSLRYLIVSILGLLAFLSPVFALTDPAIKNPWLNLYLQDSSLVREKPDRFKPKNLSLAPRDISYWKKVLPYEADRYADIYMVIPQLGLITPIQQIPRDSGDWSSMVNGHEISINKYLQWGIIEYAGSVAPGHRGNRIDFGHSNYFKNDSGRYKTVFANLMWLDEQDEVWYFVRNGDEYVLHRYVVTASYPTKPSNVAALSRDGNGADAVIFWCYNGLAGRWMIEATYMGTPVMPAVEYGEEDPFANLSPYRKSRVDAWMYTLSNVALKWRKASIATMYTRLKKYKESNSLTEQEGLVVAYMMQWFSELYE